MITQYACNKPASWPLNVRLTAAKTRFTLSKFRMLHALCSASNLRAGEKRRKTSLQANSKVTFYIITSFWFVFGLSTHISDRDISPVMDEDTVKRQHFSMVFDSLNNGTVPLLSHWKSDFGWHRFQKVSSDSCLTCWRSGAASRLVSLSNYCLWWFFFFFFRSSNF